MSETRVFNHTMGLVWTQDKASRTKLKEKLSLTSVFDVGLLPNAFRQPANTKPILHHTIKTNMPVTTSAIPRPGSRLPTRGSGVATRAKSTTALSASPKQPHNTLFMTPSEPSKSHVVAKCRPAVTTSATRAPRKGQPTCKPNAFLRTKVQKQQESSPPSVRTRMPSTPLKAAGPQPVTASTPPPAPKKPQGVQSALPSTGQSVRSNPEPATESRFPFPHLSGNPCTHNALDHRLKCGHKIITPRAPELCASNCQISPFPFANPRGLDEGFACLKCITDKHEQIRQTRVKDLRQDFQRMAKIKKETDAKDRIETKMAFMEMAWKEVQGNDMIEEAKKGRFCCPVYAEPDGDAVTSGLVEKVGKGKLEQ